jgi:hypothetical protein
MQGILSPRAIVDLVRDGSNGPVALPQVVAPPHNARLDGGAKWRCGATAVAGYSVPRFHFGGPVTLTTIH